MRLLVANEQLDKIDSHYKEQTRHPPCPSMNVMIVFIRRKYVFAI